MSEVGDIISPPPTPLELINSKEPQHWTKMIDLSIRLPSEVKAFNEAHPESAIRLVGKCEFANPGMSHKDRIAKVMLQCAEARGDLTQPNGEKKTILAASSGNTVRHRSQCSVDKLSRHTVRHAHT